MYIMSTPGIVLAHEWESGLRVRGQTQMFSPLANFPSRLDHQVEARSADEPKPVATFVVPSVDASVASLPQPVVQRSIGEIISAFQTIAEELLLRHDGAA
jgi:hypothetical protein